MQRSNNSLIARVDGKIFCEICGDHVEISKYRMHVRYSHKKDQEEKVKKSFVCNLCSKVFTSKYNLEYHLAHHYNLKNFVCDQCPNAYNTQADLNQHKRTHEKGKFNYRCEDCGEIFDHQKHYNTHMKTHGKLIGVKQCTVCNKILSSEWHLKEHMSVHTNEQKVFKCDHCDKVFMKKESRKRHIDVVHLGIKKYTCIVCSKAFGNANDRRKHELIHERGRTDIYCTYCKKYFSDIKLHDDTIHADFNFACDICLRKFATDRELNRHKLIKHKSENYICDLCGNGFNDLYQLRCHIQIHISQPDEIKLEGYSSKSLDCSICGKHFNYPRSVIRHILSVHEKVKDFECEYCSKKFSDKGDLNKHVNKIHEEKNFGKFCKICKSSVDDVKGHFEEVHGGLEFSCEICHMRFKRLSNLTYHKKVKHDETETKFECTMCNKKFPYRSLLQKHQRTHIGYDEKPHRKYNKVVKKEKIILEEFNVKEEVIENEDKKEPLENVEAIISYDNYSLPNEFVQVKQEPLEQEENNEQHDILPIDILIPNIKHEESENEMFYQELSASSYSDSDVDNFDDDDDWSQSKNEASSDEEYKSNIKLKEYEEPHKKKQKLDTNGTFKITVEKYPPEKDGKKLRVTCRMCFEVFDCILKYRDHFMAKHAEDEEEYHCKKCDIKFDRRRTLLDHIRSVHENFNCTMCKRQFVTQKHLDEHIEHHKNEDPSDSKFICSYCGKILSNQISLKLHINAMHKEIRYECDLCEKSFSFKSALYKHRLNMHTRGRTHQCAQCAFKAHSKHGIRLHMNRHHNLNRTQTRSDTVCGECGMQFHNGSTLKRHAFFMHGGLLNSYGRKCTLCHEPITSSSKSARHMVQTHHNGKKPLRQCGYCKVEIQFYKDYKEHIESHSGIFICMVCGEAFYTPEQLSGHQAIHKRLEMNLRECECDYCGHRTFKKGQMMIHMTKHMTAPELHPCDVCGKSFRILSSLYTHRLYHNDPTIPCTECDRKFYRNAELKHHMSKDHTMEKPYKCSVCPLSFLYQPQLKNHLQTHPQTMEIFKCDLCNISFGNKKKDLDQHDEIYHPEKRPFRCFICNLSFKHQHNLERHNKSKHLKIANLY